MKGARARHVVSVIVGLGEDFVPHPEADHHLHRHGHEAFGQERVFLQEIGRQSRDRGADMFHRQIALAGHHRGVGQHVAVVRHINVNETDGRPNDLAIAAIGLDRLHVGLNRLLPAPATNVDVRWHMHVVGEPGLQGAQAIRGCVSSLRMRRGFNRVDVEMIRERMFGIELQDGLERREDFVGARICLTFRRPLIPWAQIHHRLGEEGADILIIRVSLPDFAHRVRIGLVERRAIFRLRIGITMTERLDQIALHRRRVLGVLLRKLEFLPGQLCRARRDRWKIDIRSAGERDAPVRHGAFRIGLRGSLEGADRFAVVEAMIKGEALIEIALRLPRVGRDFTFVGAKPVEERFFGAENSHAGEGKRQRENDKADFVDRFHESVTRGYLLVPNRDKHFRA